MTTLENKAIPLIVVEEHHEAFYAWSYARAQRWLGDSGHVLLHVDAHADSMLPRLRRPLHSITDLASCADFVYHELDISTFIWPAVYQGLFCRILWLKHNHRRSSGGWQAITVYSKNSSKTEFGITGASLSETACRDRDAVTIEYSPITTHDVISTEYPIVLDIDLDYFCSNDYPDLEEREIEITQEAFDHFHANPYHFLRISPLDKISAVCRNNRYFLVYNDYYPERPSTAENLQTIETRLTGFIEYLQARAIVPTLIVVCRSVHSGYTPRDSVAFLQERLLQELGRLYSLTQHKVTDILPRHATSKQNLGKEEVRGRFEMAG
jgi:hypothetical protein